MTWHFDDPRNQALLRDEANSFKRNGGTPFAAFGRAKGPGGGIDCVGFCEAVLHAAGAIPEFSFPRSRGDYDGHLHNDKILDYLRGKSTDPQSAVLAQCFAELNIDDLAPRATTSASPGRRTFGPVGTKLLPGDVIVIEARTGVWHLPIMMTDRAFMQCAFPDGVTEGDITQGEYRERVKAVFRARAGTLTLNPADGAPSGRALPEAAR